MSLSNHSHSQSPNLSGKVVIGMNSPGPNEMSIQELEGKRQLIWDDATNEQYLERVKGKAKEKAKEILLLAELEAEALRATARIEGYETGIAQAQADIKQHTQAMSTEVENILGQLGAQGSTIFEDRKQDIMGLIRMAVQKTLKVEMDEKRTASLEALLLEALERIESQRQLAIKCAPEDATDLEAFLKTIQERNPTLKYWTVKGDPSLELGGIIVEAAEGKVDNSIATRWAGVEPILEQLADHITSETAEG
ncbi:MAG: flagellar assembly protein FliH [Pseudodesulfovibrio sp.]|nr:flagellar assembly protein FliH [Pseudodesulfovibrio sp.]